MATVKKYQDGEDKRKKAFEFFIKKGYSPQVSAGIVGNLVHESGLNTTIIGDKNLKKKAHGIAQWRGERYDKLRQTYGEKWDNFDNQLEFVDWELKNTHKRAGSKLKDVTTAHEAGQIISDYYEIPKKKYHENKHRRDAVERVALDYSAEVGESIGEEQVVVKNKSMDFEKPQETSIFTSLEQDIIPHTKTGQGLPETKTEKKESKEKKALVEKQNEQKFIQEYLEGVVGQEIAKRKDQEIEQIQVAKTKDYLKEYEEIKQFVENPIMKKGGIMVSEKGVFKSKGEPVVVPSPNISMKGVKQPIIGISQETGEKKIMLPNIDYYFNNTQNVLEIPIMQKGGEILGEKYKENEDSIILDYMLDKITLEKGGNRKTYEELKDKIAYHESAHTMNPKIVQKGSGIGRGKYMFEGNKGSNRILTSAKRTSNYFKDIGKPTPKFIQQIIEEGTGDATKLNSEQQDILFLGDMRMGNLDLKDYVTGRKNIQEVWADYWWQGDKKDREKRIKQFNTSLKKYESIKNEKNG